MYSAFLTDDTTHSFQLPAYVKGQDNSTIKWGVSDPTAIGCQTDPSSGGILITVQKAENVTIVAQSGSACGQSTLNVTAAVRALWDRGNSRYNSNVPLYSGCIGLGHRYPDGGPGACPAQGPACTACHSNMPPKNPIFRDVAHTPTQTAGFSDMDLINIVTNGRVPDGGYFDPSIVSYPSWSVFHEWSDIQGDDQLGMVVYLRSLTPTPQMGISVDSGGGDDSSPGDDGGPVVVPTDASVSCGSSTCTGGQVCCVPAGPAPPGDAGLRGSCSDPAACMGFGLTCNGAQDCAAGQVCCAQFTSAGAVTTCQSSCGGSDQQVCQKPKECPMGDGCRNYPYGGGVQVCMGLRDAGHEGGHQDASVDGGQ
jgi:hypothetical protein